ncbi:Inositol polyphosphate-related phosphatase [Purpureocillium lavendulum]|uniref:Inositol polyphosphate-related phosphatase n=1 Tax=Purpureocillium lavendulum TaxID=1247861 RepID=A0AB34FME7_9HYPO|nr:Inositol polyphosphate-related phosphatase [Purpureocillium lavendulum]
MDGEQLMSLAHTEGVKATAVAFKPGTDANTEGTMLWVGTSLGEIMEVEVATQRILQSKAGVHARCDVTRIYRHLNEMWTLDDSGTIHIWGPDADGTPNLSSHPHQSNKLPRGHTFSMVVNDELWHATGKSVRVFSPTLDGSKPFQVLLRPLSADGTGDVSAGTQIKTHPDQVFFGHVDGKVSVFSTKDYSCLVILNISSFKINGLAGVGEYMWVAYNTGKMCVYDMEEQPWVVRKEWQAHDQPIIKLKADPASAYRLDRLQVVSLGADNKVRVWDGLMQDDWLEEEMKSKDTKYCDFDEIKAHIMTWNAGASTPHSLRYSDGDANFFQELVQSSGSPDIFIFGFQELVDLEDKTATAKRFLKSSKKKEGTDQERMSHQYRDWRDFLMKTLDDYMPADDLYHLLHSAPMVGLFTCVFVKSSLRERIRNLSAAEVKRGMGGLHGNKGAVCVRFQVDDSSLCFINCHLAAGQSQSSSRHNDVAAILDTVMFPEERDSAACIDSFTGGGDGTMILDHELCIINGDLNYRIDTMSRDTVVKAVKQQNLGKLLERDQLLVARRRNPGFRLRAFDELPITFAPTYKYDVGTDNYDTSEKKRSPAWCDRLLYRGRGRIQQRDYRRHEVRVSDHRPVTGSFRLWVKKVNPRNRAVAWMESQQGFEDLQQQVVADEKVLYLVNTCGYEEAASRKSFHRHTSATSSPAGQRRPVSHIADMAATGTSSSSTAASAAEPRKTPLDYPTPDSKPAARPELTAEQTAKYEALLDKARGYTDVACDEKKARAAPAEGSETTKTPLSGPVTERERAWLTRDCLLRYLRATKWNVDDASRRLLATLAWRREYGLEALTADYISPEQETGKQIIAGFDREGRPCQYLNPGRQNTDTSPRQINHLFYMVERVVDVMPPGVESLSLLINFKPSKHRQNTSVPISTAREVLHILQNHYPERLGKALIINVPWIVQGFFKIITPFIDPVTRGKLKFNEDMRQYVPPEQLWSADWNGDMEFEYDHDTYWPALNDMCRRRREAKLARWRAAGALIGESEEYLAGGTDVSVSGFRYEGPGLGPGAEPAVAENGSATGIGNGNGARDGDVDGVDVVREKMEAAALGGNGAAGQHEVTTDAAKA